MKRFVRTTLLFALPIVLLAWPLDRFLSHYLSRSHGYAGEFEVMNDIRSGRAACDLAILGSSRAWVHIDPAILQDSLDLTAYNLGVDGLSFQVQHWRYQQFAQYNPPPKYVMLSLESYTLEEDTQLYNPEQFLPYMLFDRTLRQATYTAITFTHWDYFVPLVRYTGRRSAVQSALKAFLLGEDTVTFRKRGYQPMDRSWTTDLQQAMAEHPTLQVRMDSSLVQAFANFIAARKAEGIQVVLVYSPEYIEGQHYITNRAACVARMQQIAREQGVPFLDYSDHPISHDRANFYNASHLNRAGSAGFTRVLAHDLRRMGIIPKRTE